MCDTGVANETFILWVCGPDCFLIDTVCVCICESLCVMAWFMGVAFCVLECVCMILLSQKKWALPLRAHSILVLLD